jgi:hypothetical protein
MAEDDLIKTLGEPETMSDPEVWGADGLEHAVWTYGLEGLFLNMARFPGNESYIVFSITAVEPCSMETHRGIGLGDLKDDVLAAYADEYNAAYSDGETLLFGSLYGGLLVTIEDGVASGFFFGAMAE